ncbi:exosome component 10 [Coccinella septempunctata]|uniref:exosome component 10 n=1 Tax=Coccinella septempunctata TaxID=41139 RepID=UPI001D06FF1B|nr:exosome component 10 [Coccinella septempunctata]
MDVKDTDSNIEDSVKDGEVLGVPSFSNMENFTKEGFNIIKESIKSANELPLSDFDFFELQKPFKNIMTAESNRLLTMMNCILKTYGVKGNFKTSSLDFRADLLVETNDTILERVADCIDEMNGIKKFAIDTTKAEKSTISINGSWNRVNNPKFSANLAATNHVDNPSSVLKLLSGKDIKKPQESFTDKIDNSNDYPWEPRIKEKPNSLKPLAIFLEETEAGEEFSHPYEVELEKFCVPEEQLAVDEEEPVFPKPLEETNFVEVDTEEKLNELLEDLRKYKMIAIDLEHHSYRTFMGITCLMQISTGDTDYIIDTLILRNKLYILNEIFTKPSILKIFHGADSDILWLQRDLSLYIVNMFDTYQASKVLGYSSLSLAYLLERFCNFTPNKHFQMADWRMRPLPEALKRYARDDTHYLIYIYKVMKIELFKKSGNNNKLLCIVYDRSLETCKKRYFKPRCTENSYLDFYGSCKRMFDKRQMYALKELYNWRDQIARKEDESLGYVLPNHMLLQIAETLPREIQGILACCNPVPPLVRSNLSELHQYILKARDISVDQPILLEDTRARGTMIEKQKFDLDNPFFSPFDSSKKCTVESIPVLLEDEEYNIANILDNEESLEKSEPIFSIVKEGNYSIEKPPRKYRSLIPFERYSCVKVFLEEEEKQRAAELKNEENEMNTVDTKPNIPEIIEIEEDVEKIYENLDLLTEDNKTEEERLSLLSNHFSLLSHKTKEDVETEKRLEERLYQKASSMITERVESLAETGGSRKRRREESEEEVSDNEGLEQKFLSPTPVKSENTGAPKKSKKQKKRLNKQTFQRKDNGTPDWARDRGNKRKSGEGTSSDSKKSRFSTPQKNNTSQNKRCNRQIEPFDYSSVDFRQFQGGAGEVNEGKTIRTKFRTKRSNKPSNRGKRHQ